MSHPPGNKCYHRVFRRLRNGEPFNGDLKRTQYRDGTSIRLEAQEKDLTLYQTDYQTEPNVASRRFEVVLDASPKEYSLLLCKEKEMATSFMVAFRQILDWSSAYRQHPKKGDSPEGHLLELLKCHQANPQWTVAHYAANFAWIEYFEKVQVAGTVLGGTFSGSHLLHAAIGSENEAVLQAVLQIQGINVQVRDVDGWTGMHYAVTCKTATSVDCLLKDGRFYGQLRLADNEGYTPVDEAFKQGQTLAIKRLLKHGLTVGMLSPQVSRPQEGAKAGKGLNEEDEAKRQQVIHFTDEEVAKGFLASEFPNGGCPLHWVDSYALLERLLQMSLWSVNTRNSLGDTPLITFIRRFGYEASPASDTKTQADEGSRSAKAATESSRKSTRGKSPKSPSQVSSVFAHGHSKHRDRLSYLLRLVVAGGRINAQNKAGNTALHYAVAYHDIATTQMLIIFGGRVNLLNQNQESVLHIACKFLRQTERRNEERKGQVKGKVKSASKSLSKSVQQRVKSAQFALQGQVEVETGVNSKPPLAYEEFPEVGRLHCCGFCLKGFLTCTVVAPINCCIYRPLRRTGKYLNRSLWNAAAREQFKIIVGLLLECGARKCTYENGLPKGECTRCAPFDATPPSKTVTAEYQNWSAELLDVYFQLYFNEQTLEAMKAREQPSDAQTVKNPTPAKGAIQSNSPDMIEELGTTVTLPSVESLAEGETMQMTRPPVEPETARRPVNLLIFDGGDTDDFTRPLIQALILLQLQQFLPRRSLGLYFDVLAGAGFGCSTSGLMLYQKRPLEILYFFLQLRDNLQWTRSELNFPANTAYLEAQLREVFGGCEGKLCDKQRIGPAGGEKHLMLTTTQVNVEPILQKILHTLPEDAPFDKRPESALPLWEALMGSGCGLSYYQARNWHYDGSLFAANPTIDTLTYYQAVHLQSRRGPATARLPPIGLVLSLGCGAKVPKETPPVERVPLGGAGSSYLVQLRNNLLRAMLEQDHHVVERTRAWCQSLGMNYVRVNFPFVKATKAGKNDAQPGHHILRYTSGLFRSRPEVPESKDDGTLLQVLWTIKLQMSKSKGKFSQLAQYLEMCIN